MIIYCYVCYPLFITTDSYTTNDIVFKWNTTDIRVGTKQMAQFEYKGAKLSSDIDVFDIGKQPLSSIPLIALNSISSLSSIPLSLLFLSFPFPTSVYSPPIVFLLSALLSSFTLPPFIFASSILDTLTYVTGSFSIIQLFNL